MEKRGFPALESTKAFTDAPFQPEYFILESHYSLLNNRIKNWLYWQAQSGHDCS